MKLWRKSGCCHTSIFFPNWTHGNHFITSVVSLSFYLYFTIFVLSAVGNVNEWVTVWPVVFIWVCSAWQWYYLNFYMTCFHSSLFSGRYPNMSKFWPTCFYILLTPTRPNVTGGFVIVHILLKEKKSSFDVLES